MKYLITCLIASLGLAAAVPAAVQTMPLSKLPLQAGMAPRPVKDVTVEANPIANTYTLADQRAEYAVNKQYDWFICDIAIMDNADTGTRGSVAMNALPGGDYMSESAEMYKITSVKYPITGKMRFWVSVVSMTPEKVVIINPRVVKGDPDAEDVRAIDPEPKTIDPQPKPVDPQPKAVDPKQPDPVPTPDPVVVTPPVPQPLGTLFGIEAAGYDALATRLQQRVASRVDLRDRVAKGTLAVATLAQVGFYSPAVAEGATEDLGTALINAGLQLSERGRLNRALTEQNVTDITTLDADTARKVGRAAGCDFIVIGSLTDKGATVAANVRIIDVQTGKAVAAERADLAKTDVK